MSGEDAAVRQFRVWVSGFDFDCVFVRAKTHARAKAFVARAFADAGYGSFGAGLLSITACRLDQGRARPIINARKSEGLCRR